MIVALSVVGLAVALARLSHGCRSSLARGVSRVSGSVFPLRREEFRSELAFLQSTSVGDTGLRYAFETILGAFTERAIISLGQLAGPVSILSAPDSPQLFVPSGSIVGLIGARTSGRSTIAPVRVHAQPRDLDGHHLCYLSDTNGHGTYASKRLGDNLIDSLTVAENIAVSTTGPQRWMVLRPARTAMARETLARIDVTHIDPEQNVGELDHLDRALVGIAIAIRNGESLMVIDDPRLSGPSISEIVNRLRRCDDENICALVVSHDVTDLCDVADRVAVLREGVIALEADVEGLTPIDLVHAMSAEVTCPDTTAPRLAS